MQHLSKFALSFLALFISAHLFSQTIDYSTFSNPNNCNAFYNSPKIGGFTHVPTAGQPQYSSGRIELDNSYDGSNNKGTQYVIYYSFKNGYTYTIDVTAAAVASDGVSYPILYFAENNATYSSSTGCNGPALINNANSSQSQGLSSTSTTYHIVKFTSNGVPNQFVITSQPTNAGQAVSSQAFISKIVITETPPATPTFTLSPTSVSANCGYPVTQTFTVGNPNNVTGITQYVWNSSAPSSGWLYNGSPAGFPITTATNTLQLTSSCTATALSNISATVYVNGTAAATTNTATASFSTGLPSNVAINGNTTVCSSSGASTFTLSNAPSCGGTGITWSLDNGNGSLSPTTGAQTALTVVNTGSANLRAAVTTACATTTVTKPVNLVLSNGITIDGTVTSAGNTYDLSSYTSVYDPGSPADAIDVEVYPSVAGATSFNWTATPYSSNSPIYQSYNGQLTFTLAGPYWDNSTYNLTVQTACGSVSQDFFFEVSGYGSGGSNLLSVSPNPVTGSTVHVSLLSPAKTSAVTSSSVNTKTKMIYAVKVTDRLGNIKKTVEYKSGIAATDISLAGIPKGSYFVAVFDGQTWNTRLIVLQ